jgi:hypothetical protein
VRPPPVITGDGHRERRRGGLRMAVDAVIVAAEDTISGCCGG